MKKTLPAGIENFEEMIRDDYYYVDKTLLIKLLKMDGGKVTLFTRPRRFGKTLNMSMLKYFFQLDTDKSIFDGLKISEDRAFCNKYMGKYPVISITLKNVDGLDFIQAFYSFCNVMTDAAKEYSFIESSDKLNSDEKQQYSDVVALGNYIEPTAQNIGRLSTSLITLMKLVHKHFGIPVVVLIDEYDVPLDKAHVHGYYDEMVNIIRNMFNLALKTNDNLAFGVLTGCLRVSKESIFTGMNNLVINSITDGRDCETFGFTENEVEKMLSYYEIYDKKSEAKAWYDGYRFGEAEVYCPWDMVNYCRDIYFKKKNYPVSYWANTSSNDLVREFINIATSQTKDELEKLVMGEHISKKIREELTYRDIDNTIENLWSILYLTGYLTGFRKKGDENIFELWIPNKEVLIIFQDDIVDWFNKKVQQDRDAGKKFYNAILDEEIDVMNRLLNRLLRKSVSIRDSYSKKTIRENFYHGFVLGLLTGFDGINSNSENGDGYSDITITSDDRDIVAVLELKYSDSGEPEKMEKACDEALLQIEKKHYDEDLVESGLYDKVLKYGISFNLKKAMVKTK